jgi:hypothetical protein
MFPFATIRKKQTSECPTILGVDPLLHTLSSSGTLHRRGAIIPVTGFQGQTEGDTSVLRFSHETIPKNAARTWELNLEQEDSLGSPQNLLWCSLPFLLATCANAGMPV